MSRTAADMNLTPKRITKEVAFPLVDPTAASDERELQHRKAHSRAGRVLRMHRVSYWLRIFVNHGEMPSTRRGKCLKGWGTSTTRGTRFRASSRPTKRRPLRELRLYQRRQRRCRQRRNVGRLKKTKLRRFLKVFLGRRKRRSLRHSSLCRVAALQPFWRVACVRHR